MSKRPDTATVTVVKNNDELGVLGDEKPDIIERLFELSTPDEARYCGQLPGKDAAFTIRKEKVDPEDPEAGWGVCVEFWRYREVREFWCHDFDSAKHLLDLVAWMMEKA